MTLELYCTHFDVVDFNCVFLIVEGDVRKDKEAELKQVMKQLEKKYAALQVVSVIKKLGNQTVCTSITVPN